MHFQSRGACRAFLSRLHSAHHSARTQDAKASLHIKHHRNCLEADRMRRTRASAAAGAINLKQRCGQCKTCMNNYAGM